MEQEINAKCTHFPIEMKGTEKQDRLRNYLAVSAIAFTIAIVVVAIFFRPSIDYSGATPNAAGQPTKIAAQTVPTLVNGITSVTAMTIAFGAAIVGITFRHILEDNPEERSNYFESLGYFIIPVGYLWGSYLLLSVGWLDYAVTYAFTALLVALFTFIFVYLYTAKRFSVEHKEKANSEETEQEKLKREFQHRKL